MPNSTLRTTPQNVVQSTMDYERFKLIGANRDVHRPTVNRIKRSIEQRGNLSQASPINVNERFEVIDGQHRLTALAELNLPVFFTVVPGLSIEDARQMNLLHKRWGSEDFLKTYAVEGRLPYIEFQKLKDAFDELPFSVVLAAVYAHQSVKGQAEFRKGELEMFDVDEVTARLDRLSALASVNPAFKTRAMAYAFFRAEQTDRFNYDRLYEKVVEKGAELWAFQSVVDNLRQLEALYNQNTNLQSRIRFY